MLEGTRLSTTNPWTPGFWDAWRCLYDTLTPEDHHAMYEAFYPYSPIQSHFTLPAIEAFFLDRKARHVIEVGGWDGLVAAAILSQHSEIIRWDNYEMCSQAAHKLVMDRYHVPPISDVYVWDLPLEEEHYDTLVASHSLEHMKMHEIDKLLTRLPDLQRAYVDAPISISTLTNRWEGYIGSHILECGWSELISLFESHGLVCVRSLQSPIFGDSIRLFERPETSQLDIHR